jgi:hypothetical protein
MVTETYERLKKILADFEEDVRKAAGGNKAAGTRARKAMQDLRSAAQDLRAQVLEVRNADGGEKA